MDCHKLAHFARLTRAGIVLAMFALSGSVAQAQTYTEQTLHVFGGTSSDGANPAAPLLNVNGTLYGTTQYGGPNNRGTIAAYLLFSRDRENRRCGWPDRGFDLRKHQ